MSILLIVITAPKNMLKSFMLIAIALEWGYNLF